jgi:outer membrane protease
MLIWNENFTCFMQAGNDCHALSFVQRMPMPFIGLGGVVRLKVTWQFVKPFGVADVTLRLYINPINTVNDLSLRF